MRHQSSSRCHVASLLLLLGLHACNASLTSDELAFIAAVRNKSDAPADFDAACTEEGYMRIERLARLLSVALRSVDHTYRLGSKKQSVGLGGIFAQPANTRGLDYKQVKTRFVHSGLCSQLDHAPQKRNGLPRTTNICEVGFNSGHSAMLFLETVGAAAVSSTRAQHHHGVDASRVVSFDIGGFPWTARAAALMGHAYPPTRFEYVDGDSTTTIPAYKRAHPEFACDALLIDGAKDATIRYLDLHQLNKMSNPGALLFFDEICTQACANGTEPCGDCWGGTPNAYARATQLSMLTLDACAWPPGYEGKDGICRGHYLSPEEAGKVALKQQGEEAEAMRAKLAAGSADKHGRGLTTLEGFPTLSELKTLQSREP